MSESISAEIATAISSKLAELFQTIEESAKNAEPFIGRKEAAEFLDMSVATLDRRIALPDGPPRYIDGGKISFLRSELKIWRRQWRAGDQTGLEG